MHTNQLQSTPRTKAVAKGKDVLAAASVTVAPPFGMVPERMANFAKPGRAGFNGIHWGFKCFVMISLDFMVIH